MRLVGLQVRDFRCVARADVDFAPGLNVLYGPNDLGKSTLATALRAGLLLLHGSSEAKKYVPWGTERKPRVQVRFAVDDRTWRVSKTFATGSGGASLLEWSNDGESFSKAEEGRAVDGEVRRLLAWGIEAPGGKKRQSGLPRSFLSSVLLGEQALPYRVFEETLSKDDNDAGRKRLTEALQALATDPLYQQVLDTAQAQVDLAFDSRGKHRSGKGSPFRGVVDEIKRRHAASDELDRKVADADAVAARLAELDVQRDRWMTQRQQAQEAFEAAQRDHALGERRATLKAAVDKAQALLDEIARNKEEMARLSAERKELDEALPKAKAKLDTATTGRRAAEDELGRARQKLEAAKEGGAAEARAVVAKLQQRKAELDASLKVARARVEAAAQRTKAAALRTDAAEKLAVAERRGVPDAQRRAKLRKIQDELRLLRARLGGGVSVQLRLAKSRKVDAKIDGGDVQTLEPTAAFEAQSEVELDLGRTGSIEIVGGEADARRDAREAQARFDDVVAPVLQRCEVEDLEALEAVAEVADAERASAERLEAEAATLLRLADAQDDAAEDAGDAKAQLERVAAELATVTQELAAAEAAGSDVVEVAEEASAKAEEARAAAERAEAKARAEVERIGKEVARAKAALEVRREQAVTHDPLAAAEAFAKVNDELGSLPKPERAVGEDALNAAQQAVATAERSLDDALGEVRKQEGALQQVGGQVIREKADAAREALEAARRRQAEVELDYDGWRLLRDALRDAENEEGQHIGRALGKEVGERFEALTRGRYGALSLGPDLDARGLKTDAGTREIGALSEGLKEQLATILRVCIAQHLQGVLVLDDHLAQTDPGRATWFRKMLRDAASEIQIVVLTCRPDDYLAPDDTETHRIDLAKAIERV